MSTPTFTRRQFLFGSLAGVSVLGAGGCASVCGREKIRLAVVGMMGKGLSDWLAMLRSGKAEIVAFCDADANYRLEAARLVKENASKWGVAIDVLKVPFYTDYRKMLDDDGDQQKDGAATFAAKMPQVLAMDKYNGKVPRTGCLIIGSKGILCSCADYGQQAFFAFNNEKVARDTLEHEACRAVLQSIPRRSDVAAGGMTATSKAAGAAALNADGHYVEFSIPLMEGILVGTLAQRVPGLLKWNSATQTFDNGSANRLVKPFIRSGWKI